MPPSKEEASTLYLLHINTRKKYFNAKKKKKDFFHIPSVIHLDINPNVINVAVH